MSRQIPIVRFVFDALIVSLCPFSKQRHVAVSMTFLRALPEVLEGRNVVLVHERCCERHGFLHCSIPLAVRGRCLQFPIESPSGVST